MANKETKTLQQLLQGVTRKDFCPLDFLAKGSLTERVISLVLGEVPPSGAPGLNREWQQLIAGLRNFDVSELRVVVFGGGTGLSNIVGGDSRRPEWPDNPFAGLKEIFPKLHSIVCVTDDGGSTGEILKDFPLVALGDLRHVLLSSIRSTTLKEKYQLDNQAVHRIAGGLHSLFNYRFISSPDSAKQLLVDCSVDLDLFPSSLAGYLFELVNRLFCDPRMTPALKRPQCLGNLLLASAIYEQLPSSLSATELATDGQRLQTAIMEGLSVLSRALGAGSRSVLPCTTTSAQLQVLYANGVLVTSESKSGSARRGYPVDRVLVEFSGEPQLPAEVEELVSQADVIIMAPGSLYSSIIPILQVPGLTDLIRTNTAALKLLVANIWVQKGETDATREAPERKFYVSDLILAYEHNISGGIKGLFSHILTLDLADIPGSVLQNYAIEKKEPIYLDHGRVRELGLEPVEAYIFSRELLRERNVIQHAPSSLSLVVKVLCGLRAGDFLTMPVPSDTPPFSMKFSANICSEANKVPCLRYKDIVEKIETLDLKSLTLQSVHPQDMTEKARQHMLDCVAEIIWRHPDIHLDHFDYVSGVCLVDGDCWKRCQEWDNVFSFYDPDDRCIKIRRDQSQDLNRLEMAFLVGLGQSLLGNYAEDKRLDDVFFQDELVGRVYSLRVRDRHELCCLFSSEELDVYLQLCRMYLSPKRKLVYTRVVNGVEGFTPPGLLFGLFYAWYLDNRFAPNIDYKMSIMKNELSYLIPEQVRIVGRREQMIRFFRENVFRRHLPRVKLST